MGRVSFILAACQFGAPLAEMQPRSVKMTLNDSSTTVILEKLATDLGYAMNEIRSWLDSHRIKPIGFKTLTRETGGVAMEIRFNTEDEAYLFLQKFSLNGRMHPA
jgi:hypothetical protein